MIGLLHQLPGFAHVMAIDTEARILRIAASLHDEIIELESSLNWIRSDLALLEVALNDLVRPRTVYDFERD